HNEHSIENIKVTVPVIAVSKGASVFAQKMIEAKPDVIPIDWNADIKNVKQTLPEGIARQGNLDPNVLYANKDVITKKITELFERMRGEPGFIFNLGHGIQPDMSFDHVKHAVEVIKAFRY